MVATRVSVDDINLGARASHPPPEKRARSSSPVKQRRPTQDWSSLARSADGSLDRLFSTTSLSHDQLMLFSNSDISERLHISKADYAIPIPFQIQFPPRLTRKSSTSLLSSDSPILSPPQKLIFTGHSYEPVSPSIPSSPTFGHISPVSRPLSPVKPPPVTASRKKVSEFVKQTSSETSDQLSMIEEKSNAGNSRASSYKSKDLPSIPNGIPELSLTESRDEKDSTPDTPKTRTSEKIETQITPDVKRSPMTNTFTVKHKKSPILKNHAPGESERLTAAVQPSTKLNKSVHVYNMDIPELPSPRTPNKNPRTSKVSANSSNFPSSLPSEVPSSSTAIRHDTFVNTPNLKTDKRAFSEESRVSSVSSFSSFGDILNFTHTYMSSPNAKGEVRVSKHVADYMLDNDSSNNNHSTQAGIPPTKLTSISDKELKPTDVSPDKTLEPCDISDSCLKLNNTICDEGTTDHLPRSPKENSKQNSGIQPTKSLDTKPQDLSYSETEPLVISRRGSEKSTEEGKLDDNIGAGIGFHFPNNKSNATNSSDAKKKSRAQRPRARDSARSSMFSEGKIEIPDLDDESFWQTPMASPSVTISAPIPSTKRNLNTAARERSFDSDSDSSFNSQFTKLQSKTGSKNLPASKSSTTISSASSPIRHSRHRSMYNIDFDYKSVASPTHKQHNRSKSNACVGSSVNSFSGLDFLKKPQHVRNSSFHGQSRAPEGPSQKSRQ
ncbi:hypothetical protein JCM33374_g797 [Metschnikowia sp. JCM 33374]|nr:hypothetical protein JCM33374_g797 [Metschnikowia sp. JCM 33374]